MLEMGVCRKLYPDFSEPEVVGLSMANVKVEGQHPHVHVPAAIAKRNKARQIPLWWDAATLAALTEWKAERVCPGPYILRMQPSDVNPGQGTVCAQLPSTLEGCD